MIIAQDQRTRVVWTIAGFDPSSGAGVTADLMTFAAHGLFGCSAITAYTAQSTLGVATVEPVRPDLLAQTLDHLLADLPPAGAKIGMLGTSQNAEVVGEFVQRLRSIGSDPNGIPLVLDPVLRSSSGRELYPADRVSVLHRFVLPFIDWLTPNWSELALLSDVPVATGEDVARAAGALLERHPRLNLVVTGGDQDRPTEFVWDRDGGQYTISGEHVETSSTHGTGCAFSSALLSQIVCGATGEHAVRGAKAFVAGALRHAPALGHGKGPMDLLWPLREDGEPAGTRLGAP